MRITKDLIGKKIIRTSSCFGAGGDKSYMDKPNLLLDVGEINFYITSGRIDIDTDLDHATWDDGNWKIFHQCKINSDYNYCPQCGEKLSK